MISAISWLSTTPRAVDAKRDGHLATVSSFSLVIGMTTIPIFGNRRYYCIVDFAHDEMCDGGSAPPQNLQREMNHDKIVDLNFVSHGVEKLTNPSNLGTLMRNSKSNAGTLM